MMKRLVTRRQLALAALVAGSASTFAGTPTWFIPLTESAPVTSPVSAEELTSPWATPAGISQKNAVSLREVEDEILSYGQSIGRAANLGSNASMFDMMAYDPQGEYLFIPHETQWSAGVTRYSIYDNHAELIFQGDGNGESGDYTQDFGAFDPCRFTPNGTLFLAEEWAGTGRVLEVLNPYAPVEEIETRVLESIPNVSHEGINFSKKYKDTIYFVDEDNSGSIYKFVMSTPGDYTKGQSFVLSVDDFDGVASENWNSTANATATRTGNATWIPLTDEDGNALPGITDPFVDDFTNLSYRAGRVASDNAGGTPFGRPEDCAVSHLRNGREVLYFAATSENAVYSVEILGKRRVRGAGKVDRAIVRVFASETDTPKNLGFDATTATLNSPDNLSVDALGNVYVVEDAPNSSSTGGDIWMIRDTNSDGVAESLDHFLSIRVDGSEATGMIWNPVIPTEFAVNVQHPDSTDLANVPNGLGDAVWIFNVTNVADQKFVKRLNKAGKNRPFGE
ncbi:hypothetical protein HNR46_000511 [Haloferula luteola]|uniref:DUF839 domain-containing protein n=1 Tax=Haloferula luteola TaxID=595692 RepID=A0A840UVS5_9BACT|nr:alkaline phosphatase PhoX [Haloferula luteola]MBB5350287.1 hypothetical protein [Haloferula luteola]